MFGKKTGSASDRSSRPGRRHSSHILSPAASSSASAYPSTPIRRASSNSVTAQTAISMDPDATASQAQPQAAQSWGGFAPYLQAAHDPLQFGSSQGTHWPPGNNQAYYATTSSGATDNGSHGSYRTHGSNDGPVGSMFVSTGSPDLVASPPPCHQATAVKGDKTKGKASKRDKRKTAHKRKPSTIPPGEVFLRDNGWGGGQIYYDPDQLSGATDDLSASPYPLHLNDADLNDQDDEADQRDASTYAPHRQADHDRDDNDWELV